MRSSLKIAKSAVACGEAVPRMIVTDQVDVNLVLWTVFVTLPR